MLYELWGGVQNGSKIRHHNRFKNWAGQWPVQIETIHGGFNIEVNVSQIARGLNVDRRTANKHINGFQRSRTRVRNNCITPYYDTDKESSGDSSPRKGAILATNINLSGWDSVSYDAAVANAMLDRGLHHSHAITINGASYRARDCLKPQNERKEQT